MSTTSIPVNTTAQSTDKSQLHAGDYTDLRPEHPSHHKDANLSEKFDKLEEELKETTNDAVAEGQEDVAKATASYLEQALHFADTGLAAAQGYVGAGKERLQAPHQAERPPTGLAASLAATAASALDAAGGYLGLAQQKIHQQHQQGHHTSGPAHPVTSSTKPMGQALSDNVTAVQEAVQPHVDSAYATAKPHVDAAQEKVQPYVDAAQPHIDAAREAAQPHIDTAKATVQPHIDAASAGLQGQVESAKQAWNSDKPLTQQAQETAQPHVDSARRAASDVMNSDKSLMQQAQDAASSMNSGSKTTTQVPSNPILERANETHPSVEPAKPGPEYPVEGSIVEQAAKDSKAAAESGVSTTYNV